MAPDEVAGKSGGRTLELFPRYSSLFGEESRHQLDTPPFGVTGFETVLIGTLLSEDAPAGEVREAHAPELEGDEGNEGSSGYLAPGNPEA